MHAIEPFSSFWFSTFRKLTYLMSNPSTEIDEPATQIQNLRNFKTAALTTTSNLEPRTSQKILRYLDLTVEHSVKSQTTSTIATNSCPSTQKIYSPSNKTNRPTFIDRRVFLRSISRSHAAVVHHGSHGVYGSLSSCLGTRTNQRSVDQGMKSYLCQLRSFW